MKAGAEGLIGASEDGVEYLPLCEKCAGIVEIIVI